MNSTTYLINDDTWGILEVPATQSDVDCGLAANVGDLMVIDAETGAFLF